MRINTRMDKLRNIHTTECYTAVRKKKSQLYTAICINLKNILSRSKTQEKIYFTILFIKISNTGHSSR